MKAKDCAEIYLNADDKQDAIAEIGVMFVKDTGEIIKQRKLNNSASLQSVLKEQSNKWKAFCRQVNGEIKEEGFSMIIEAVQPELKPYLN